MINMEYLSKVIKYLLKDFIYNNINNITSNLIHNAIYILYRQSDYRQKLHLTITKYMKIKML